MALFWLRRYGAMSIRDLVEATGINRGSISLLSVAGPNAVWEADLCLSICCSSTLMVTRGALAHDCSG
jgi:hypothetical protein